MEKTAFYTKEMAAAWKKIKSPVPITVDIVGNLNCLGICIYENEVMKLNDTERMLVMNYLRDVKEALESFGVDTVIEGLAGGPRRIR